MAYQQPFQTTGFHSCDRKIGLKVLNGEVLLNPSKNRWDWLGPGVYFWEQNPARAMEYAEDCARGRQRNSGRIEMPFIIGAIIELGNCLNLVEPKSIGIVKQAHRGLERMMSESGDQMPANKGANRILDCAVIQYGSSGKNYTTVRWQYLFHSGSSRIYFSHDWSKGKAPTGYRRFFRVKIPFSFTPDRFIFRCSFYQKHK